MNEKSILPKIKGDKENAIRIYNHLCLLGLGPAKLTFKIVCGVERSEIPHTILNVMLSNKQDQGYEMTKKYQSNIDEHKKLELEYEQINANFRMLADVRFKLLALIPVLGGAAVFVLSHIGLKAGTPVSESIATLFVVAFVSIFGFFATLGITIYEQRNSELYNALIHRAKYLETAFCSTRAPGGLKEIDIGGQFRERSIKNRKLIFVVGHDLGLSLIYGPLLGAWFFPLLYSVARLICVETTLAMILAAAIALVPAIIFVIWLLRLDSNDKRLYDEAAFRDGLHNHANAADA